MKDIDLREGTREFRVFTRVVRNGTAYMGPDVIVNARDSWHAQQKVVAAGHSLNHNFSVKEQ